MSDPKEVAGRRAAELVLDGMTVGLGTGSTVHFALVMLAERVAREHLVLRCVPTSRDTETKARALGLVLASLEDVASIDLTIDGADEIDPAFDMIKGGGGALLREKVVASISERVAIVAGRNKLVERLGTTIPLPNEVVPFARPTVVRALEKHGCTPVLRTKDGVPFVTDNGNWILDCRFEDGIAEPARLARDLKAIPGIVETGLFIGLAHVLVIGDANGACEVRTRAQR